MSVVRPDPRSRLPSVDALLQGKVNGLGEMLPEYYQLRGWTAEGVPSNETIERLGL